MIRDERSQLHSSSKNNRARNLKGTHPFFAHVQKTHPFAVKRQQRVAEQNSNSPEYFGTERKRPMTHNRYTSTSDDRSTVILKTGPLQRLFRQSNPPIHLQNTTIMTFVPHVGMPCD